MAFAGSNKDLYPVMQGTAVDIGGSASFLAPTGVRVYLDEGVCDSAFPSKGPWDWSGVPAGARGCVSIRPALWELVNSNLDSNLHDFLMAAPAGPTMLLGLWHEASSHGPAGSYSCYFDSLDGTFKIGAAGLLRQAQAYVQKKANDWGANVKVGAIEVVEDKDPCTLQGKLRDWMAPGLDFYACDVYDFKSGLADPAALLDSFRTVCDNLDVTATCSFPNSGGATIGVTETNSRFPGRRPFWFTAVWSWLKLHGFTSNSSSFLTFWKDDGEESGAWIPEDWATIDALYSIFAESSP